MGSPSAPEDPNARHSRCKGCDFSTVKTPIRFRASYSAWTHVSVQGPHIGFRTFRPIRGAAPPKCELFIPAAPDTLRSVSGGCYGESEPSDLMATSKFASNPDGTHCIGFRIFMSVRQSVET